jgi:methionyl-tRNA formyltransferase
MLAFMSGWLGEQVLEFLITTNNQPQMVVVPSQDEIEIINICNQYSIPFKLHTDGLQEQLALSKLNKEWLLTIWSSIKLLPVLIDAFENSLNIHPSLVPLNKGNDCAAWSLRNQTPAGVSIITVAVGIDDGDVYCQSEIEYEFPTKGAELHALLLEECLAIFKRNWQGIVSKQIVPKPQVGKAYYHTRKQTNLDRVKKGKELLSLEETLKWMLAHDFNNRSSAEVIIDGKQYKISVNLEQTQPCPNKSNI